MTNSTCLRTLMLCLMFTVGVTLVAGNVAPQTVGTVEGKFIHIDGRVLVNGAGISGSAVLSDSTITTAARSSAVVSLGKLGRVEVFPQSTMKLSFSDANVSVSMLEAGRVRLSSSSNVTTTATTKDAQITSTGNQRNEFTVDTSCGNTFVAVKKGTIELRAGSTVKQIAAGNQDSAGQARPGCTSAG